MQEKSKIPEQYSRMSGTDWFNAILNRDVTIIGLGGIGSHLSFLVSRLGCRLLMYDHDTYEGHNLTGQLTTVDNIGKNKAQAMLEFIEKASPECQVEVVPQEFEKGDMISRIVLCGLDSMTARKDAFSTWKSMVSSLKPEDRKDCLFIDGRLLAEFMQIYCIKGDDVEAITAYEQEHLFEEGDVEEVQCSVKQTSHAASMIASHMATFLTNFISNTEKGSNYRSLPFYYEYMLALNFTKIVKEGKIARPVFEKSSV